MPIISQIYAFQLKKILTILFALIVSCINCNATAQEQSDSGTTPQVTSEQTIIASRVDTWIDNYFPDFMEKSHTPGAVFILVDKNGPLIVKGYGKHSFEDGNDIDPAKHLFRIASITKTMTGLGVMKLVNEGKIDLDADVNQYFTRFQIPDTFKQPITTRHLLQHNSGISDEFVGLSFTEIKERRSMGDFLEKHVPQRFFPPGKYGSYTNRAFMILGHLIEEVSGQPYEDWMESNVFKPLGMNNTGFYVTEEQKPWFTEGSFYVDGNYQKATSIDTISRPSGDAISTAIDMGRYARMLLNGGDIDGLEFLKSETVEQIFSDCSVHHDIFPKGCLSFARTELPDGSVRYQHGGNYGGWRSDFAFFPDLGVGYFVSTNGAAEYVNDFRYEIAQKITGKKYNVEQQYEFAEKIDRADELIGNYRTQFISSTFEKIYHLIVGDTVISLKDDATLIFRGDEHQQISPLVFRNLASGDALVFEQDETGTVQRFLTDIDWFSVGEKLEDWEKAESQLSWLKYSHIITVLILILFLIVLMITGSRDKFIASNGKLLTSLLPLTNILWLVPVSVLWLTDTTDIMAIQTGLTTPMKTAFIFINLAVYCSVICCLLALLTLFKKSQPLLGQLILLLTTVNTTGLVIWVNYWNLFNSI